MPALARLVRLAALLVVAGLCLLLPLRTQAQVAPHCPPGETPRFRAGFAFLRELLGPIMGDPMECEHVNPENGDILQRTTTGLAYYRPHTNIPSFTDGYTHWAWTAQGLVRWQGDALDPPGISTPTLLPTRPAPPATATPTATRPAATPTPRPATATPTRAAAAAGPPTTPPRPTAPPPRVPTASATPTALLTPTATSSPTPGASATPTTPPAPTATSSPTPPAVLGAAPTARSEAAPTSVPPWPLMAGGEGLAVAALVVLAFLAGVLVGVLLPVEPPRHQPEEPDRVDAMALVLTPATLQRYAPEASPAAAGGAIDGQLLLSRLFGRLARERRVRRWLAARPLVVRVVAHDPPLYRAEAVFEALDAFGGLEFLHREDAKATIYSAASEETAEGLGACLVLVGHLPSPPPPLQAEPDPLQT